MRLSSEDELDTRDRHDKDSTGLFYEACTCGIEIEWSGIALYCIALQCECECE